MVIRITNKRWQFDGRAILSYVGKYLIQYYITSSGKVDALGDVRLPSEIVELHLVEVAA